MIGPRCLLFMVVATLPVAGQGEAASRVEFRVTRFDPGDRPSPEFRAGAAGGEVDVKVPLTYIAGPHTATLRDGAILDFWRGGGEKPEISLPIAREERKDLLLVFTPSGDSFKVMKVRTPPARIGGGDRFLVNATDGPLAIKLGDADPLTIESGESGLVRGPGGRDPVSVPVLISRKDGGEWKLVSTEHWVCDPRFRKFLFAYISPRSGHLAFHGVSERL